MMRRIAFAACTVMALVLFGCASSAAPVPTADLSSAELFQTAQDAGDKGDYSLAIQYYQQFQTRFPQDVVHQVWAEYEIAMLYHKMGNNAKAIELFDALLARYAAGEQLPDAPRILAEKVRDRLVAAQPKKPAAAQPSQAAPQAQEPAPQPSETPAPSQP